MAEQLLPSSPLTLTIRVLRASGPQTNSLHIMSLENITQLKTDASASLSGGFRSHTGISPAVDQTDTSDSVIGHLLDTPTNGWCDVQTVTDGYKMKGFSPKRQLIQPETTKPIPFCAVQHILDSYEPPSCPRSHRPVGWHPRQRSHHSHDMVAPPLPAPWDRKLQHTVEPAQHLDRREVSLRHRTTEFIFFLCTDFFSFTLSMYS